MATVENAGSPKSKGTPYRQGFKTDGREKSLIGILLNGISAIILWGTVRLTPDAGTGQRNNRSVYNRVLHHTHLPGSASHHNLTVAYIS
jgi:hypothetical protein